MNGTSLSPYQTVGPLQVTGYSTRFGSNMTRLPTLAWSFVYSRYDLGLIFWGSLWEDHDNLPVSAVSDDTEELSQHEQDLASYL